MDQLLQSPIFDGIRVPSLELCAPFKIKLPIDKVDSFDYENNRDRILGDKAAYRKALCKEIRKLKKDTSSSRSIDTMNSK